MGVELQVDPLVGYGPRNFMQEVGSFYKEVCAPTDAMDVESDEDDECIIAAYEDRHLILCLKVINWRHNFVPKWYLC